MAASSSTAFSLLCNKSSSCAPSGRTPSDGQLCHQLAWFTHSSSSLHLNSAWQELCGIWAYIKWEQAGCPNRSKEEADREYEAGIQELVALLRRCVCGGGSAVFLGGRCLAGWGQLRVPAGVLLDRSREKQPARCDLEQ